ncbi:MAG: hypothetical protein R3353_00595 [Salegentibacter mishustinae]|nr:hypothetical protein [Salegentibacter mishustinae]
MVKNNQTVVFFFPNVLRDAHRHIFQLDRLKKEGFNIILLDATKFYGKEATATEKIILEHKVECEVLEDFITLKKSLPKAPVIFISYDQYVKFAAPVFDIIIRKRDVLLSYHTKRFASINAHSHKAIIFLEKAISHLDKLLPISYFGNLYKQKYKLYIPDYYLCSTEYLIPTKVYLTVKKENRIIVHADDMNHILGYQKSVIDKNQKIGVFLDQGIPFLNRTHPKIYTKPLPDGYLDTYYQSLEKSLKELKLKLNLDEVVIALHPDAKKFPEELEGKFSGFRTFMGESKDLIRDANFVFGHCSAALNFAIYYKKPVIILKDDFLMEYHSNLRKFTTFFIEELGMTAVEIDKPVPKLNFEDVSINEKKYLDFTRKYLKDNDIQENSYYYAINKIQKDLRETNS